MEQFEELRKKSVKDLEALQKLLSEAEAARDRAERSKTKMQLEVSQRKYEAKNNGYLTIVMFSLTIRVVSAKNFELPVERWR